MPPRCMRTYCTVIPDVACRLLSSPPSPPNQVKHHAYCLELPCKVMIVIRGYGYQLLSSTAAVLWDV